MRGKKKNCTGDCPIASSMGTFARAGAEACLSEPMGSGCASEHKRRRVTHDPSDAKHAHAFCNLPQRNHLAPAAAPAAGSSPAAFPPLPPKSLAALKLLLQMRARENQCRVPPNSRYGLSAAGRECVVEFIQEVCVRIFSRIESPE